MNAFLVQSSDFYLKYPNFNVMLNQLLYLSMLGGFALSCDVCGTQKKKCSNLILTATQSREESHVLDIVVIE